MDRIIVTGGLGHSGTWIVDRLVDTYDQVLCVDRHHPGYDANGRDGLEFRAIDLADRGEVYDLVSAFDPDAVVHWGAIPRATRHTGGKVFENNAVSTYNVLTAAGRADARVVQASSESVYGLTFARDPLLPEELPITEEHPQTPEDPYGASKVVTEDIADMVTRRHGVQVASIRPLWIQYPGEYVCRDQDLDADLSNGVRNFWSYVDIRDIVSLVEAALEADFDGHEAFNGGAAETYLGRSVPEAIEEFFGEVPDTCTLSGMESAFSTEKAAQLLGWQPEHTWQQAKDAEVAEPELLR